jgi:hypothetical protein
MREAVSFGQSPCLFLVYGPGFQVPVSVSVYCVLSGAVFWSDVWGFAWSGCCALVDAVACICICCCGCARCIRLWSCHLYLVLFLFLHPVASASVSGLSGYNLTSVSVLSGYTLTFIPVYSIISCPVSFCPCHLSGLVLSLLHHLVPASCPVSCSCYLFSTIWSCDLFRRAVSDLFLFWLLFILVLYPGPCVLSCVV